MNNPMINDFSYMELFINAHIAVKVVMIMLILASVYSWAIILQKTLFLKNSEKKARKFEKLFWSGETIDNIAQKIRKKAKGTHEKIFLVALREWEYAENHGSVDSVSLEKKMIRGVELVISRENDTMQTRLSFLASVGSIAPFIGLFGTVWGIMSSFQSIALSKNTDISVVAPGIAEALFATALGLLAAIPAVLAYNKFNNHINRLLIRYENFAEEFFTIISRMSEHNNIQKNQTRHDSLVNVQERKKDYNSHSSSDKISEEPSHDNAPLENNDSNNYYDNTVEDTDNETLVYVKKNKHQHKDTSVHDDKIDNVSHEVDREKKKHENQNLDVNPRYEDEDLQRNKTNPTLRYEEIERSLAVSWKKQ